MSVLKVANEHMYRKIGQANILDEDVGKFFIQCFGKRKAEWWFRIYIHGRYLGEPANLNEMDRLIKALGYARSDGSTRVGEESADYHAGWGNLDGNAWELLFKQIETTTNV